MFQARTMKTLCFTLLKNVTQMRSPVMQAHLNQAGKPLYGSPAFLSWNCSYYFLQVTDNLGIVPMQPGLKVSPYIKI